MCDCTHSMAWHVCAVKRQVYTRKADRGRTFFQGFRCLQWLWAEAITNMATEVIDDAAVLIHLLWCTAVVQEAPDDERGTTDRDTIFERDYSAPTGEDKFNKELLPKIMQVTGRT